MTGVVFGTAEGDVLLAGADGTSLMLVGKRAGLLEGECEGSLACATCHVIVDPAWAGKLAPPSDDEEAMLDTVFELKATSRLSCQIRLAPGLDGLRVVVP